jgi:hypothetical protein
MSWVSDDTSIRELQVPDIDTFAVIFGEREAIDRSRIAAFQQRMAIQYPFQTGIEIGFVPYHAVCDANSARGSRLCSWHTEGQDPRLYQSWRRRLSAASPDVISVCWRRQHVSAVHTYGGSGATATAWPRAQHGSLQGRG